MEKRVTIKDIALEAGVSIGTVHCALYGKPGVGEDTRRRVADAAARMGYRPNAAAASLKRKKLRIAAAFPDVTEENRYYFSFVWDGIRDYIETLRDFNVELLEFPFHTGSDSCGDEIMRLAASGELDGVLTTGYADGNARLPLSKLAECGVPFVLVGSDDAESGRLACVSPSYNIIGRTVAELVTREIGASDGILLLAGDVKNPSHYLVVQGFDDYMRERGRENPVYKIHVTDAANVYGRIESELRERNGLRACFAVNARGSVMLGRAIEAAGLSGALSAVGSDLFSESMEYLKNGAFTNLVFKKPYSQAQNAAKYLADFLIQGTRPPSDMIYVGNEIIFQSSLPMYDNGLYRPIR